MDVLLCDGKKGRTLTGAVCLLLLLSFTTLAFGQGIITGSVSGSVTDPSGAAVVGAKVTARNQDTNQAFPTVTNETGFFSLTKLPPGKYDITVEAPSFAKTQLPSVEVVVAKQTTLNEIRLRVGSGSEVVEVTGAAPLVETGTAQVANTIDSREITSLPIGGGTDALALYMPGVSSAGSVGRGNSNGAMFSVNGQRPRSNNFQIDGQGTTARSQVLSCSWRTRI